MLLKDEVVQITELKDNFEITAQTAESCGQTYVDSSFESIKSPSNRTDETSTIENDHTEGDDKSDVLSCLRVVDRKREPEDEEGTEVILFSGVADDDESVKDKMNVLTDVEEPEKGSLFLSFGSMGFEEKEIVVPPEQKPAPQQEPAHTEEPPPQVTVEEVKDAPSPKPSVCQETQNSPSDSLTWVSADEEVPDNRPVKEIHVPRTEDAQKVFDLLENTVDLGNIRDVIFASFNQEESKTDKDIYSETPPKLVSTSAQPAKPTLNGYSLPISMGAPPMPTLNGLGQNLLDQDDSFEESQIVAEQLATMRIEQGTVVVEPKEDDGSAPALWDQILQRAKSGDFSFQAPSLEKISSFKDTLKDLKDSSSSKVGEYLKCGADPNEPPQVDLDTNSLDEILNELENEDEEPLEEPIKTSYHVVEEKVHKRPTTIRITVSEDSSTAMSGNTYSYAPSVNSEDNTYKRPDPAEVIQNLGNDLVETVEDLARQGSRAMLNLLSNMN